MHRRDREDRRFQSLAADLPARADIGIATFTFAEVARPHYSKRSASMGLRLAARRAGK